jgi:hypothetical protein
MTRWRRMIRVKGVYNLIAPPLVLILLPPAGNQLFFQLFLALAFVFGYGYLEAAKDPVRNRAVIVMGIWGQASVLVLSLLYLGGGPYTLDNLMRIGAGLIDGTFAWLFRCCLRELNDSDT